MEERKPLFTEEGHHVEQVFSPLHWLQMDIVSLRQEVGGLRQEVRAEFVSLRQEIGGLRQDTEQKLNKLETGLRQEIGGLRQDTEQKLNKLETGLRQEMCVLRQETKAELVSLRKEIGSLRQWSIATMFTVIIAAAGWALTMFR